MKISGFTFIHNALEAGYPIIEAIDVILPYTDEMVVIDMKCTDGTVSLLERKFSGSVRIIEGYWEPGQAGACLAKNHAMHRHCTGDVIWHFEADEVFGVELASIVGGRIRMDSDMNLSMYRLQVEQNFQRVRWYPELVHRVFPNNGTVIKEGHTTDHAHMADVIEDDFGYIWDVTNCFRDNCIQRFKNQAELWGHELKAAFVGQHMVVPYKAYVGGDDLLEAIYECELSDWHWESKRSPFALPESLKRLVGVTDYRKVHDS